MTQKRMTIADIAKLANTSTATVSHFLNGKFGKMSEQTRRRIEKIVDETGYSPNAHAQGLVSRSSGVIAILIEDNTNTWAGQLVRGVERVAHEGGYLTVVCDTHFDPKVERSYVEKMLSLGVDGFVIQPTNHYRSLNERLTRAGKPVVFYDFSLVDLSSTWVKTDLYGGVYDAVSTCVERGYDACMVLAADINGARTRSERLRGASDALAERGIAAETVSIDHETPSVADLRHHFEYHIDPSRRTLVFCPHQWALSRALKALDTLRHLMPEHIGLLGLNNTEWTDLTEPGVSTIVEPVEREGELACSMLIERMRDPEAAPRQQMLSCETRWLSSTL
ncbi:LacI family DNA-binding transcriptional regulator [Thermophilibacter sp.]